MKKYTVAAIVICMICALSAGCSGGEDVAGPAGPPPNSAAAAGSDTQEAAGAGAPEDPAGAAPTGTATDTDADAAAVPEEEEEEDSEEAKAAAKEKEEADVAAAALAAEMLAADVDVDFIGLNNIMLQAELNNLRTNSDQYEGKTIRISGPYYSVFLPETNQEYHFVTVVKGDACCIQGLEFRLSEYALEKGKYPDANRTIVVIGTIEKYEEWGSTYLYLSTDRIAFI